MRLRSKEVFARHENGRPVAAGFVSYISNDHPILMHCSGREDYSDGYDDYAVMKSYDNGRTWTAPELLLKSYDVEGGRVRYAEPTAFFDPDTQKLLVISDRVLYPDDTLDVDAVYELVLDIYDPITDTWTPRRTLNISPGRSIAVSFGFPIKTSRGRLVVPAMRAQLDANGHSLHYRGCWAPVDESLTIIGEYEDDGSIRWTLGWPVAVDPEKTSRGLDENTLAELRDGRIAMVCRGDNSMFPERPGYKWLCFSDDDGMTWSDPVPLPCDTGDPIESGANGSAFFRSITTGKLYWIGNLCIHGVRPKGNWPRAPLVVVEVQEEPFALKRDTITVIDQRSPTECEQVQHSNFRFYQDRENGDLVLFLTRYGERSAREWMLADYYRYRVEIG
jgi:hypothetical protein